MAKKPQANRNPKGKKIPTEKRAEILATKLSNPDLSAREVAEKTGTSKSSADRIIKQELGSVGTTEKAKTLRETNLLIIAKASEKVLQAIDTFDPADIREAKEMQGMLDTAFKQNRLIEGESTENVGVVDGAAILRKIQQGGIGKESAYEALR